MSEIKFYARPEVPVEMHKVKIVQKLNLLPAKERLKKMQEAGFNTFMLHNGDIFMDMLTDSGVNAMSDNQQAAMLRADDAYAGSETFYRMEKKLTEIFGINHLLPTHQGRACEHIIAQHFVKPDSCVIMNYHFTTSKAHVTRLGGRVEELVKDEGLVVKSDLPFKGNIDLDKVKACIEREGADNIAFLRLEAGTNLIGGQPISYENMKEATELA
ncbi:MAG: tryptophanase, partial [Clostridia bacterium]|nr:tryptophanase [Clostridia bacterium]